MTAIFREIEFENNSPKVCYSGQLLKGQVHIYFPVETSVKGEHHKSKRSANLIHYNTFPSNRNIHNIYRQWILSVVRKWRTDYRLKKVFRCASRSFANRFKRLVFSYFFLFNEDLH